MEQYISLDGLGDGDGGSHVASEDLVVNEKNLFCSVMQLAAVERPTFFWKAASQPVQRVKSTGLARALDQLYDSSRDV